MKPNAALLTVLGTLHDASWLSDADAKRLTGLIVGNPYLLAEFNRAAASGALRGFAEETNPWNGASFDSEGIMSLRPAALKPPPAGDPMDLTFTLGHEIAHANDPRLAAGFDAFLKDVDRVAASRAAVHDYTPALATLLGIKRDGEGLATIGGFNAVHAALVARGVPPTVANMLAACPDDMPVFLDDRAPRGVQRWNPSLRLDHDGSLLPVAGNVTVMNSRYFHGRDDEAGVDYLHNYAAWPINRVLHVDRSVADRADRDPARVVIDFRFLGLSLAELKDAGVGTYPAVRVFEKPSGGSPSHVIGPQRQSLAEPEGAPLALASTLVEQARGGVARLDAARGRATDATSEQLTLSMAALAQARGFTRIDHVLLNEATAQRRGGEIAFVVQGALDAGDRRMAMMPMAEALDPATPGRLAALPATAAPAEEPSMRPAIQRA